MGKWFGKIGYVLPQRETEPGIWESEEVIEKNAYGDLINDRIKSQNTGEINNSLVLANTLSIIADPFVYENCSYIAYAEIMGTKWKVTDIDASIRPRLILTIGGVYK